LKNNSWKDNKERSSPFFLNLICWIALNLSRPFARFWLYPITFYYLITSPKVRSASFKYFERIDGFNGGLIQTAKHIFCFSAVILDRVYFLTGQNDKFEVVINNSNLIDKIIENRSGCILLGSHIGSFDVLQYLSTVYNYEPINFMMNKHHNSMITEVLNRLNPSISDSIIDIADENALFKVRDSIASGGFVGMLGDRVFGNEKQVQCRLLGGDIFIPVTPFAIADVLKVPIITFTGVYLGGNKYSIYFEELPNYGNEKRDKIVYSQAQHYVSGFEKIIKKYPYNWFNFYDYWDEIE